MVKRHSTSSIRTLSSVTSFASSSGSIPFQDEDMDFVTEEGLRHADMKLEAR